jgi:hypothetical protein
MIIDSTFDKDDRFSILPSTIPKAGFGLFAKKEIKKDERLYVHGIRMDLNEDINICTGYARNYKFADPRDSKKCIMPINYAGMVNQSLELKNADIANDGDNLYFEFIRDIHKDEEIFTHYGDGWCDINNSVMAFLLNKLKN